MNYRNDFAKAIAENIERGDKEYAHKIRCWERNARKIVIAAINAGFSVGVNDGEETVLKYSRDVKEVMRALFSTDEDYLLFYRTEIDNGVDEDCDHFGWVYLVYGNGIDDLVNDYSTNLDPLFMEAVNEWADKKLF